MFVSAQAIVVANRAHGEHGAVVRVMTADEGLLAGYVRGGRSRALRPVLMAGNLVRAELRARTEAQLAALTVELVTSRSALLAEPLAGAAVEWTTALVAAALPEGQSYPAVFAALDGVLLAIESAPSARGWAGGLAGFEEVMLRALGYGAAPVAGALAERLAASGEAIAAHLLTGRRAVVLDARARLVARLLRALD